MRARWRALSGDPSLAAQALTIITPLLAPRTRPRDLLIRAGAASSAGNARMALASLEEALSLGGPRPLQRALAQRAQTILSSLSGIEGDDQWKQILQARIDRMLQGPGPRRR